MDIEKFNNCLEQWLNQQNIYNITVSEGFDFCYYYEINEIQWGMIVDERVSVPLGQFFIKHGLKKQNLDMYDRITLSFLHEVGHVMTKHLFDVEQDNDFECRSLDDHWNMPIEYAATKWAIDWINEHYQSYNDLYNLFKAMFIQILNGDDL